MDEHHTARGSFDRFLADLSFPTSTEAAAGTRALQRVLREGSQPIELDRRYTLIRELGRGGMGVVWLAHDQALDRSVAVKRLTRVTPDGLVRFQREAQAVGQLNHPAIVEVFDVGEQSDEPYIVMEYVEGEVLRTWQADRPWRAVLDMYLQAAEGLIAAHAAGLVHRDFKPHNVLVDQRQPRPRARVLDFGLVASANYTPSSDSLDSQSSTSPLNPITATGAILGTPAYMAPEQFRGDPAEPATDQFAWCVSVWEGLYGERPFRGASLPALHAAVESGDVCDAERSHDVPRWLEAILRKGLSPDPDARHPSLDDLTQQVRRRLGRGRYRRALAVMGVVATVGGAAALLLPRDAEVGRCENAAVHLEPAWGSRRRDAVRTAISRAGLPYAASTLHSVDESLKRYTQGWTELYEDACRSPAVDRAISSPELDLRMGCLFRARRRLSAITEVLASADDTVVANATSLLAELPSLSRCADLEALRSAVEPPDPAERDAVEAAYDALEVALAARVGGRPEVAAATITDAEEQLRGVRYEPVRAEMALEHGRVLRALARYQQSETRLREALRIATAHQQRAIIVESVIGLMFTLGEGQRRMEDALALRHIAERFIDDDPMRQAELHNAVGVVLLRKGDFAGAQVEFTAALVQHERSGRSSATSINMQSNFAIALAEQGHIEEARRSLEQVLAAETELKGAGHPETLGTHYNLAMTLIRSERVEQASAELSRALALADQSLARDNPLGSQMRGTLALTLLSLGQRDEAEAVARRVIVDQTRSLGAEHARVGAAHSALATILLEQEDRDPEALTHAERAWRIAEATETPPKVAGRIALTLYDALTAAEPGETDRRRELLHHARRLYEDMGDAGRDQRAEVEERLAAMP